MDGKSITQLLALDSNELLFCLLFKKANLQLDCLYINVFVLFLIPL